MFNPDSFVCHDFNISSKSLWLLWQITEHKTVCIYCFSFLGGVSKNCKLCQISPEARASDSWYSFPFLGSGGGVQWCHKNSFCLPRIIKLKSRSRWCFLSINTNIWTATHGVSAVYSLSVPSSWSFWASCKITTDFPFPLSVLVQRQLTTTPPGTPAGCSAIVQE